jgi:NAD(P)-dependent dehydrogenase (short-subunit alcohol dehydrogenase family)
VDMELGAARKMVEVNVLAPLTWSTLAYKAWMGEHGGAIVDISSVAAVSTDPGISFYGASKGMLAHMTRELALERGPRVRVNAIGPALVKTKMAAALYEGREEELAARYPLKRLGAPEDIAGATAFLLSDDAAWITGQLLLVDGGFTLVGMK